MSLKQLSQNVMQKLRLSRQVGTGVNATGVTGSAVATVEATEAAASVEI